MSKGVKMKKSYKMGAVFGSTLLSLMLATTVNAAPDPNFHIYLAFGQSNMEGQGVIGNEDKNVDERFQILWSADNGSCSGKTKGQWAKATPPLAHCNNAKLGPTDYFGRTMVEKTDSKIKVGVVVVAVAGCSIKLFDKDNYKSYISTATATQSWMTGYINQYGGNPYGRLIEIAKKAQEDGVIKGIIFHQGETDAGDGQWPSAVKKVYDNIIKDLGLGSDIPFLAGEVLRSGVSAGANQNIAKLPQQSKNFYVVSSEGFNQALGDGQNVHFTAEEYREFGKRYAEKMIEVLGEEKLKPVEGSEPPASSDSPASSSSSEAKSVASSSSSGGHHHSASSSGGHRHHSSSSSSDNQLSSAASSSSDAVVSNSSSSSVPEALPAMAKSFVMAGKAQVFDMQGKFLGTVDLASGASLKDIVAAKFQRSGRYLLRQDAAVKIISVEKR